MTFNRLEKCLLPPPETVHWNRGNPTIEKYSLVQKISYCAKSSLAFIALLLVLPFTLTHDWLTQKQIIPIQKIPDLNHPDPVWPPVQRGFATSLFQTAGLGTKWSAVPGLEGKCDWDQWMDDPKHVIKPETGNYKDFYTDILSDPTAYIDLLKAQHVTAHRFSLEWSVIEPEPGRIDERAVQLYQNFIQKLIEADITPSITLSHFVMPQWFYKAGNFQTMANIDLYVRFATKAMELFPNVTDWWSFNELGVKGLQQAREVYPTDIPEGSTLPKKVHAAGIATRNMLIAHCKLYQKVKELYPNNKLGVTHQWLKFDTATGNWLEKLVAYFFTNFSFTPVYRFLKKGEFSFEFPFMANIRFVIPPEEFKANHKFLSRLGVQAYPKPMIKMGLNHGETYPGLPESIKNLPFFSFGSSCEPGGTVMRFGPRHKASGINEVLDDAFEVTDEVYVTEYGSDANVHKWGKPAFEIDDETQKRYLQQLTEQIRTYCVRTKKAVKGIFCWSDVRGQMEWETGHKCQLGIIHCELDQQRRITATHSTPASVYLANVYGQPAVDVTPLAV